MDWTSIKMTSSNGESSLSRDVLVEADRQEIDAAVQAMKKLYDRRRQQEPRAKEGESTYRFQVFNGIDTVIELFYLADQMPQATEIVAVFMITRD